MIKTAAELAQSCLDVARKYKTLYVLGCIGSPMNDRNKDRYSSNLSFNRQTTRQVKIKSASADTFGFDCVCMIKSLLWGWTGDKNATYGGATYASNSVPDIGANQMIKVCTDVTTDFSNIQVGEAVWIEGHIGVYVGDGLAVECTHRWDDGVQITAVHNLGTKEGYNGRTWTKHGKLPYVTYSQDTQEEKPATEAPAASTATAENTCTATLPVLKNGSKGDIVKVVQILLVKNGCSCGSKGADGVFGTATENAVMMYQDKTGLFVDGICGPKTWASLLCV